MLSILFGSTTENTNTCPDVYLTMSMKRTGLQMR